MQYLLAILIIIFLCNCNSGDADANALNETTDSSAYVKEDLQKIKWIEGKWKGLYKGNPFYEFYQLINDSTLEITSFDWNGKDSSNTSRSYLQWQDGSYYLGSEKNYKTISISGKEIVMKKNYKANNDVLWRYNDSLSWEAILEGPKGKLQYHMERFDPFKKN